MSEQKNEQVFTEVAEDDVASLVNEISSFFLANQDQQAERPSFMTKELAYRLLLICLMDKKKIIEIVQMNDVITKVVDRCNKTGGCSTPHITAGELMQKLKDIPESTPVYIEATEISKHSPPKMMKWESVSISKKRYDELLDSGNENVRFEVNQDKYTMVSMAPYYPAFGGYQTEDESGNLSFCLHVNY